VQRCSIHEELAKGEFKLAGAIAAGGLGRGVPPVVIRREQSIQTSRFTWTEGWLETQLDESVSTVELS